MNFDGTVFVPESEDWVFSANYDDQVRWEWEALNQSTVVAFWIPRELEAMPAFTTNVEFGLLAASGKILIGYPQGAPKMRYLHELANRYHAPVYHTLNDLLLKAVERAQANTVREV
jgi:Nucleoside 2-deoxyribosyltransferase like